MTPEGSPQCRCGVFAIGSCKQCSTDVCGLHGSVVGDRLLCSWCEQKRVAAAQARAAALARESAERSEAFRNARVQAIRTIADPVERLLAAMSTLPPPRLLGVTGFGSGVATLEAGWERQIQYLCPECIGPEGSPAYESAEVVRWFADRAIKARLESVSFAPLIERRTLFGGTKSARQRPVRAWVFQHAVQQIHRDSTFAYPLYVLEDGRMFTPRPTAAREAPHVAVEALPPQILWEMADLLGLGIGRLP